MSFAFNNVVSEDFLKNVQLPKNTDSYTTVPNSEIIDIVHEKLDEYGLQVKQEICTSSKAGRKCIVNYDIIDPADSEMGFRIAWKNSYDRTMSFGIAIGSVVWVCSNGMLHGEETAKRVHTGDALSDVIEQVKYGMDNYQVAHQHNIKMREQLKSISVSAKDCSDMFGKLCMKNVLNGNELYKMRYQLFNSDTFNTMDKEQTNIITAWDLYNHGTEVLKNTAFNEQFRKHEELIDTFKTSFGL